jgi:hypothetical protein
MSLLGLLQKLLPGGFAKYHDSYRACLQKRLM